jgi:uncharacterized protein
MRVLMTAVLALGGALLFQRLGVPAGALIGAMASVAAFNLLVKEVPSVPSSVKFLAFAAIGWAIGSQFTVASMQAVKDAAWPILASVLILIVLGGAIAWLLWWAGGIDPLTAFLAACPGGLAQMVSVSSEMGANSIIVTAVHLVRLASVLFVAPVIARVLSGN